VTEELDHVLKSATESKVSPLIIGFCCQYGLFGTGTLANLWRVAKAGIWIIPVLCIAKVETDHLLRAFEMGAEGVFVAGCGEQCARENTVSWAHNRVQKARKVLAEVGLEPSQLQIYVPDATGANPTEWLDRFVEQIGGLYLTSLIMKEVKVDSR
jgi:coenzyme F420-reducing hydrogenase delta subunit